MHEAGLEFPAIILSVDSKTKIKRNNRFTDSFEKPRVSFWHAMQRKYLARAGLARQATNLARIEFQHLHTVVILRQDKSLLFINGDR